MVIFIILWIGGKCCLVDLLLFCFFVYKCYVEVFVGGVVLYFMWLLVDVEVINDINGELVNFYCVVQWYLEEFVWQFKWVLLSCKVFVWLQNIELVMFMDIECVVCFYYLQQLVFGVKVEGQNFGIVIIMLFGLNLLWFEEMFSVVYFWLVLFYIEYFDWVVCIECYDWLYMLFYFDLLYWEMEGYGVDFLLSEYECMVGLLCGLKGKVIVSLNDYFEIW